MPVIHEESFYAKVINSAMQQCGYLNEKIITTRVQNNSHKFTFYYDETPLFSALISLSSLQPDHIYIYLEAKKVDPNKLTLIAEKVNLMLADKAKIVLM